MGRTHSKIGRGAGCRPRVAIDGAEAGGERGGHLSAARRRCDSRRASGPPARLDAGFGVTEMPAQRESPRLRNGVFD